MTVSLTHSTVVTVPDDAESPVGTDEWNAEHTLTAAARSVLGVAGSAAGAVADIVASADGQYLQRSGGMLAFTTLSLVMGTTALSGGADKQVLFNDSGAINSNANFTYDKTAQTLIIGAGASTNPSVQYTGADDSYKFKILPYTTGAAIGSYNFTYLETVQNGGAYRPNAVYRWGYNGGTNGVVVAADDGFVEELETHYQPDATHMYMERHFCVKKQAGGEIRVWSLAAEKGTSVRPYYCALAYALSEVSVFDPTAANQVFACFTRSATPGAGETYITGVTYHQGKTAHTVGVWNQQGIASGYNLDVEYQSNGTKKWFTSCRFGGGSPTNDFWLWNQVYNDVAITFTSTNNFCGIGPGGTSPQRQLHIIDKSSTTNDIRYPLRLQMVSTGTAAAGIGVGVELYAPSANGTATEIAVIEAGETSATAGSVSAHLKFSTIVNGSRLERVRMRPDYVHIMDYLLASASAGHTVAAFNQVTPASYNLDIEYQSGGSKKWFTSVRLTGGTYDFWFYDQVGNYQHTTLFSNGGVGINKGLRVGDTSAAPTDGGVSAKYLLGRAVTYANRPAAPVEGMLVAITDSSTATWGATIAGGGANHVLAYYNGTNWTVAGI